MRKINSYYFVLFCMCISHFQSQFSVAVAEQRNNSIQSSGKLTPLLPIRRVGIELLKTNTKEFREFAKADTHKLSGIMALPLTEEEISAELSRITEKVVVESGRFWHLSVDSTVDVLKYSAQRKDWNSTRIRLQKSYDLDAWIGGEIYFAPEQTIVRTYLRNTFDYTKVIAREDIIAPAQSSFLDLEKSIQSAITRLISTIGHDGRVTYERDNLVGIDFGLERGINKGTKLKAGYVLLAAEHPQTHEFLRSHRITIQELEVVEAKEGTALCKVTAYDNVAADEVSNLLRVKENNIPQLVWQKDYAGGEWKESQYNSLSPIIGGAESGFRNLQSKISERKSKEDLIEIKRNQALNNSEYKTTNTRPETKLNFEQPEIPSYSEDENSSIEKPSFFKVGRKSDKDEAIPITKKDIIIGLGIVRGNYTTTLGDRNTGFPNSILNYIYFNSSFEIENNIEMRPKVEYMSFSAGDIEGDNLRISLPVLSSMWSDNSTNALFKAGAGIDFTSGKAIWKVPKEKFDLGEFNLNVIGEYEHPLNNFGNISAEAEISLLRVLVGEFGGGISVKAVPFRIFPQNLNLKIFSHFGPKKWNEIGIGFGWNISEYL